LNNFLIWKIKQVNMIKYQTGMKITAKHLDPKTLTFSVFTADDIKNLSVKKITTPDSFNLIGHPLIGGLYDPYLGSYI
jgi:DNA-directed RNA polymerase I subunit RPA1